MVLRNNSFFYCDDNPVTEVMILKMQFAWYVFLSVGYLDTHNEISTS